MNKGKRVLGVDLGLKRTGLALSDELGLTTRALPNLTPRSRSADIETLLGLCEQFGVAVVVFGYPVQAANQESALSKRFLAFASLFRERVQELSLGIKIVVLDESYSSKKAAHRLAASAVRQYKRRHLLDGEAARILIEDYLAFNNGEI